MREILKFIFGEPEAQDAKCGRLGHKKRMEYRRGYTYSNSFRAVADGVTQERCICRRCGHVISDWTDTDRYPIHSLTMDSNEMRTLERDGEIWR